MTKGDERGLTWRSGRRLRMVVAAEPQLREKARGLWQEAKELNLISGAIRRRGT
jgi:hypothetical protein